MDEKFSFDLEGIYFTTNLLCKNKYFIIVVEREKLKDRILTRKELCDIFGDYYITIVIL